MKKILPVLCMIAFLPGSAAAQTQPPAPAASPSPAWLSYKSPYAGEENDLGNPHRTADEMAIWAQQAAADVLSFNSKDYKERLPDFRKYFVQAGWESYTAYLKDAKLINMVSEQGYSVGTIVDSVPEVVSFGPMSGAYHWILKMPITISLFNTDAAGDTKTGPSGKYTLFMDVERVAEGGGDNGVAISNWRVDAPVKTP